MQSIRGRAKKSKFMTQLLIMNNIYIRPEKLMSEKIKTSGNSS